MQATNRAHWQSYVQNQNPVLYAAVLAVHWLNSNCPCIKVKTWGAHLHPTVWTDSWSAAPVALVSWAFCAGVDAQRVWQFATELHGCWAGASGLEAARPFFTALLVLSSSTLCIQKHSQICIINRSVVCQTCWVYNLTWCDKQPIAAGQSRLPAGEVCRLGLEALSSTLVVALSSPGSSKAPCSKTHLLTTGVHLHAFCCHKLCIAKKQSTLHLINSCMLSNCYIRVWLSTCIIIRSVVCQTC